MEADLPTDGLLPVIKCSNCNASVGISEMGEHICNGSSQRFTPPPDHYNYRNPFDSPPNPPGKSGRYGPPPKIDPFAANRPFLHLGVLTPADTDDTPSLSPSPLKRSQTSPLPPTPDPANEDGSFTPFVRSHTVAGSTVRSKPRTPVEDTYSPITTKPFETSPVRSGGDAGSDNENSRSSIPQEPVPYEERRRPKSKQKHRREMSIDSKSMLLISAASSRYGDESLNHYSPRKLSTSGRNVLDEVPPLPAGPIKSFTPGPYDAIPSSYRFESKEDFELDRLAGESLPKEQQKARVFGSFDFGLPSQPKISRNPDSSHFRDPSHATTSSSRSFKPPVPEKDEKPNVPEKEHPTSPIREYRINEDFSVSNFARDLGLNHSTHPSISSSIGTTPSDMASGSSHSTGPSDVSSGAHSKSASDNMAWNNLSIDVEPRRQGDLAVHGMDSPTDPSFQNGYLSSAGQKTDLSQPLPVFPTQHPIDKRAVSPPARTATRTPVGRRPGVGVASNYCWKINIIGGRPINRCQTCQMVLRGDYFEWNGLAYCERDGRHAAAAMYPPQPPSVIMPSQQSGPSARRPLYPPRGYGYGPRPGPGPGPRYGPGGPGMRYPPHKPPHPGLNVPAQGMYGNTNNSRRYPERRTTRLMMI
ncbi:predicted protein [Histoplasma mississippiense (nom. inval.)]|uniref:predicted protein n=1 Tax=Ajellomyces capsulatus (strain NAm1 / WU24) TaxID=2059318 RepID=UPI000157CBAC|nr:predicted protein [Histoplasma mississippiense (nom. inval.)]EDN10746.1 predicted protein [Histoplasma mississippiense (nom. inval.)]